MSPSRPDRGYGGTSTGSGITYSHTYLLTYFGTEGSDGEIYYETSRDIACGSELLVWYGDCYVQFMGIPVGMVDYTSARPLSSLVHCNSVIDHRRIQAGVDTETNCEFYWFTSQRV